MVIENKRTQKRYIETYVISPECNQSTVLYTIMFLKLSLSSLETKESEEL